MLLNVENHLNQVNLVVDHLYYQLLLYSMLLIHEVCQYQMKVKMMIVVVVVLMHWQVMNRVVVVLVVLMVLMDVFDY